MMGVILGTSPFFDAYAHSDVFGKMIFIALFFLSMMSWVLLIYKLWLTYKVQKSSRNFGEIFKKKKQHLFSLEKYCPPGPGEISNAFFEIYLTLKNQTLEILKKNREFVEGLRGNSSEDVDVYLSPTDVEFIEVHLQATIANQGKILGKNLFVLSTVVSLAPFLGLLGTVWGILLTFGDLQAQSAGNTNEMVLGGLSMALATTVLGLVVAIPALVSYNYLRQHIRDFETEMENFSSELLATVEMLYRKVDVV